MAKSKKFDLENPAPILDHENEETLAAIDEGTRDAEAGRVASAETARELLSQPKAASSRLNIKELLLGPSPRFGDILPKRGTRKTRTPIDLN